MNQLLKSFWIGVVGDIILQIMNHLGFDLKLDKYFKTHGILESILIAGGTMLIALQGFLMLGLKKTLPNLFIYGAIIDFVFWKNLNIMPSVKYFYDSLSPVWTSFLGGFVVSLNLLPF